MFRIRNTNKIILPLINNKPTFRVFENIDILDAREEAVVFVKSVKEKLFTYKDIQLILNYSIKKANGKIVAKKFKILTGKKMGTNKILPSLSFEADLFSKAKINFPKIQTNFGDVDYILINQYFNSLYYFTAL